MRIMVFCSGALFLVALMINFGVMTAMLRVETARWTGPIVAAACLLFFVALWPLRLS